VSFTPTLPPTARCIACRQRRLSTDLCPVCQMCAGCGCSGECDRVALEMQLRQDVETEAAGMDGCAEVEP